MIVKPGRRYLKLPSSSDIGGPALLLSVPGSYLVELGPWYFGFTTF
jgi:hypothetical protein